MTLKILAVDSFGLSFACKIAVPCRMSPGLLSLGVWIQYNTDPIHHGLLPTYKGSRIQMFFDTACLQHTFHWLLYTPLSVRPIHPARCWFLCL